MYGVCVGSLLGLLVMFCYDEAQGCSQNVHIIPCVHKVQWSVVPA